MGTTPQHNNKNNGYATLEEFTLKYLSKKGIARFSEFFSWLQTAMTNPPAKSAVSTNLDKMAEEGKIFSWNKKGARYIATVTDFNEIKKDVYNFISKKWIEKDKIKFDEIEENMNYPPKLIHDALMSLVSDGKILNKTVENVTYYRLPWYPDNSILCVYILVLRQIHTERNAFLYRTVVSFCGSCVVEQKYLIIFSSYAH